jgi:hypothetical protein
MRSVASDLYPGALAALARSFANTDLHAVLPTITVPARPHTR